MISFFKYMDYKDIIRETFDIYYKNFTNILPVAAIIYIIEYSIKFLLNFYLNNFKNGKTIIHSLLKKNMICIFKSF